MNQIRMDSILTSVKKLLGIAEDYEHFDGDIIVNINSAFSTLHQLGVGPATGFRIQDKTTLWSAFIDNELILDAVKTYVYLKVRLIFDPPTTSAVLESIRQAIAEAEFRINVAAESATT